MEATQTLLEHFGWMMYYTLLVCGMMYFMAYEYRIDKSISQLIPYMFLMLFNIIGVIGHIYCITTGFYIT
jgi:hypothetical protein